MAWLINKQINVTITLVYIILTLLMCPSVMKETEGNNGQN